MNGAFSGTVVRWIVFAGGIATAGPVHAQGTPCADKTTRSSTVAPLVLVGSPADDRSRLRNDIGDCAGSGSLIRSPLTLSPHLNGAGLRVAALSPVFASTWNSAIPVSLNDGAMWAGRGLNTSITAGLRVEDGPLTIVFAPEVTHSANLGFPILPSANPARSTFASPWHNPPESADLPLRFGATAFSQWTFGQSAIELHHDGIALGATTENQWWGPGIRDAIVMSDNAAGIPQAYVSTAHPLHTRIGDVEGRWLVGTLTESPYFDHDSTNDRRAISAAIVTLRVAADTGLTFGLARAVYAPASSAGAIGGHFADVLTRWNQSGDTLATPAHPTEQIGSLFFRWVVPSAGIETYGEWARLLPPRSLRELIVDPQRTQGFTVGLQWVAQLRASRMFRMQAEATTLEQTPPAVGAATPTFYTSHAVPQGYTQRGQVLGAAIGPGGSTQWLASDLVARRWQAGVLAGRIRWEDEAYYREPNGFLYRSHDVSLFTGLRGGLRMWRTELGAELFWTQRNNYLFQTANPFDYSRAFDIHNTTLRLFVQPWFGEARSER